MPGVQADAGQHKILNLRTVAPPQHAPGLFPRWLREQGAGVVIAGGIGRRALDLFAQQGIAVRAGQVGTTVEELAAAYLDGCAHHYDDEGGHDAHHGGHK